jgi:hypothetical protein
MERILAALAAAAAADEAEARLANTGVDRAGHGQRAGNNTARDFQRRGEVVAFCMPPFVDDGGRTPPLSSVHGRGKLWSRPRAQRFRQTAQREGQWFA